jgi:hypothetical protein
MKSFELGRFALSISAAVAFLAGCGGSQSPIGTVPQSSALGGHRAHERSSSGDALIYVATHNGIEMVSYPQGKVIGLLSANAGDVFPCSDPNTGNVFVPEADARGVLIYEYAHGGTSPVATLKGPANSTLGACSVDPTTGNLAVTSYNYGNKNNRAALLVYDGGKGTPKIYTDAQIHGMAYPAYDGSGNLFLIADNNRELFGLYELPVGQSRIGHISVYDFPAVPLKAEWDGTYLTVGVENGGIEQIQVSGSTGTIVNDVTLNDSAVDNPYWIQDGAVVDASSSVMKKNNIGLGIWSYPAGGNPTSLLYGITKGKKDYLGDMTISINPGDKSR